MATPKIVATYATAIIVIAVIPMMLLAPTASQQHAWAAINCKQGTMCPPTVTITGTTASANGYELTGVGANKAVTSLLEVTASAPVTCANPGQNDDVPGQRASSSGSSEQTDRSTKNGNAVITPISANAGPLDTSKSCPNKKWTATVGEIVVTATLTVTSQGQQLFFSPIVVTQPPS